MDDLRLPAVAARVVAWHNRHPLARRITVAQVHAVGYVSLPFVGAGFAGDAHADACVGAPADAADEAPAVAPGPGGESGPGGGTLRERALARTRQQEAAPAASLALLDAAAPDTATPAAPPGPLQADFSENFIDPLSPRQVARFAARAGQPLARAPADGPLRVVRADGRHAGRAAVPVYLLTAAIETGIYKSRVLLGGGAQAPVLGRRIWSPPRLGAVLGLLALCLVGLVMAVVMLLRPAAPQRLAPVLVAASAAASAAAGPASSAADGAADAAADAAAYRAASAAASGAAPEAADGAASAPSLALLETAPTPTQAAAHEAPAAPASAAATATATAAAAAAAAVAPHAAPEVTSAMPAGASAPLAAAADAAARMPGRLGWPSIQPPLSEQAKAAARQARNGGKPQAVAVAAAAQPSTEAMPAAAAGTSAFALSTRPLRTRAEAEQLQVAMQSLLKTVGAARMKVDVLAEGDDWRVVGWPFANRADADQARALLVSRGMRVQVVGF